jgi:hypothetical protein
VVEGYGGWRDLGYVHNKLRSVVIITLVSFPFLCYSLAFIMPEKSPDDVFLFIPIRTSVLISFTC